MTLFLSSVKGDGTPLLFPKEVSIDVVEELRDAAQYVHMMSKKIGNSRARNADGSSTWEWSDCLYGDVDGGMSIEEFKTRLPGYEWYLVTSRNHQKEKDGKPAADRFHVYFPVERMEDEAQYVRYLSVISNDFEDFDKNVKDSNRQFYGSPAEIVLYNPGDPITYLIQRNPRSRPEFVDDVQMARNDGSKPLSEMVEGDGRNGRIKSMIAAKIGEGKPLAVVVKEIIESSDIMKQPLTDEELRNELKSVIRTIAPKEIDRQFKAVRSGETEISWFDMVLKTGYLRNELIKLDIPAPVHYIKDVITESSNILFAPPKWGKSWLSLQIASAVAQGVPIFGRETVKSVVLYMSSEDNLGGICDRAKAQASGHDGELYIYPNISYLTPGVSPIEVLSRLIQHHQAKFIVIDTLSSFFGSRSSEGKGGDAYEGTADLVRPIHNMAGYLGVSVMVVHHSKKYTTGGMNDVNGSNAYLGGFDNVITCSKGMLNIKGRRIKDNEISIRFDDESLMWIADEGRSANDENWLLLLDCIIEYVDDNGPVTALDITKYVKTLDVVTSKGESRVTAAIDELRKEKRIGRTGATKGTRYVPIGWEERSTHVMKYGAHMD